MKKFVFLLAFIFAVSASNILVAQEAAKKDVPAAPAAEKKEVVPAPTVEKKETTPVAAPAPAV